ncbi:MAG: NosD domain-containing protein [Promethearchaeota archaeon]
MRLNRKTSHWIIISIILFISISINNNSIEFRKEANLKISVISGKIEVDGNSGWILLKNGGMCNGSGTPSDPYVIKDLEIDGGGLGNCIYIRSSNVHFKIENCTLYNSGVDWSNAAIKLADSVSNGQVINNTIYDSFKGIYVWNSNDLNITRNNLFNNYYGGIYLSTSSNNMISENVIFSNGYGIYLRSSDSNDILENDIRNNFWTGLHLTKGSDSNTISRNVFDYDEIKIFSCSRNIISWNTITNTDIGIYIDAFSLCNEVSNNQFDGNGEDIQDFQDLCPDLQQDFLTNLFIIVLIIGISSVLIIGIIISRRRSSNRKITLEEKPLELTTLQEKKIVIQEQYPMKKEKLEVIAVKDTSQEKEIIEVNQKKLDELPIEEEIPIKKEIKEDVFPTQEGRLIEEVLEMENIPEKQQIIEKTSLGPEERTEKEVFMPKEVEIKEKIVVNEVETIKEEITEKIKITATSNLICQYCSFKNENDANYCVQCGQAIKKR